MSDTGPEPGFTPLDIFLQDCSDAGHEPVTVLLTILVKGDARDIAESTYETAMELVDWDEDDSNTLAHNVASVVRRVCFRRFLVLAAETMDDG